LPIPPRPNPKWHQGVAFFNLMRDLTASGFFTTEIGVKDLGFIGNSPNKWTGVPDDVLKHYNMQDVKAGV
jgi:3-deoxy-D-arabino-heptulosonate 7-phosphate (DAHP) synthase class II